MPKICYTPKLFKPETLVIIGQANTIIDEYAAQGFDLTLRQLYYQFVARDLLANRQTEYKRLGGIINDARLAGLIDWERITDRTRNLQSNPHWNDAPHVLRSAQGWFALDKWAEQTHRVEVWIEKDALSGVFAPTCEELDVPYFSCRGYTSQSEVWAAGMRLKRYARYGQIPVILHFGDHEAKRMQT